MRAPVVVWSALGGGIAVIGLLVAVFIMTTKQPLVGVGGADGELGGDFTLQSAQGPVSLSDYQGKVVVVYFGFLNCPKVCPTSMGILKQTLLRFEPDDVDKLQMVLVSVDPERDTVENLAEYTAKFHRNIVGVTGTQEALDAIIRDYGAHFELVEARDADLDYVFRHSSRYFIVNQEGRLVDAMRHSTTVNELVARLKTYI